jgi:hypothetical protein
MFDGNNGGNQDAKLNKCGPPRGIAPILTLAAARLGAIQLLILLCHSSCLALQRRSSYWWHGSDKRIAKSVISLALVAWSLSIRCACSYRDRSVRTMQTFQSNNSTAILFAFWQSTFETRLDIRCPSLCFCFVRIDHHEVFRYVTNRRTSLAYKVVSLGSKGGETRAKNRLGIRWSTVALIQY